MHISFKIYTLNANFAARTPKKKKNDFYDMIYLLTAIGLSPGGTSIIHIYTQTIHRTIQNKQYIEQHMMRRGKRKVVNNGWGGDGGRGQKQEETAMRYRSWKPYGIGTQLCTQHK
jgi:hypothetical protein